MLINNKLLYKDARYYGILIETPAGTLADPECRILLYDTDPGFYDESPISIQIIDRQFLPKNATLGMPFMIEMNINNRDMVGEFSMNMSLKDADINVVYDLILSADKYLSISMREILKQTMRDYKITKCIN